MSDRSDFDVAIDALKHYSKKLQELKEDDDVKQGNSFIISDVEFNSKEALEVAKHLETRSSNIFHDYTEIICSALTLYQRDLELSKNELLEKLGSDIHFKWDKMDDEIKQITAIRNSWKCPKDKVSGLRDD